MKVWRKISVPLAILVLCMSIINIPVSAASETQDGLKVDLITDKEKYNQDEQIGVTLTVTNNNDMAIKTVTLENIVPDGYSLLIGSEAKKQVTTLESGETITLNTTFALNSASNEDIVSSSVNNNDNTSLDNDTLKNKPENLNSSAETGDNNNIKFWKVLLILACCVIVVLIALKRKSNKKLLSLFLCMIIGWTLGVGIYLPVEAVELKEKSITISESIAVDNTDLVVDAIVKYEIEEEKTDESTGTTKPEYSSTADEYYWNNSKVIKVVDVKESNDLLNEKQVIDILEERGFNDYPIIYEYSIDGEYDETTEVSEKSADKHPMYMTYYMSEAEEVWTIFVINGTIIANPVSFNLESNLEAQLLISESDELTSYDNETNKFYITIPKESAVIVKTVETIDAKTLERLTIEEISKL